MIQTPRDNGWDATTQAAQAATLVKHSAFFSALSDAGFSPDRIEELWLALDHESPIKELIDAALEEAVRDNTRDVYGDVSPNGEEPPSASVSEKERGRDFDVPSKEVSEPEEPVYQELDPFSDEPALENADIEPEEEWHDTFPLTALPEALGRPVRDWMRHLRMPALLPSICALAATSAALGRGLLVRSNVGKTYANTYALMGAESGTGKSLVYNEAFRPLEETQERLSEAFRTQAALLRAKLGLIKVTISATHSKLQKATKGGVKLTDAERAALEAELAELHAQQEVLEDKLSKPPCVWTSDFTSEALAVCLANNDEKLAVLSDEGGIALYNLLGRYTEGNVTDDILLCKCYSVNAHGVDRIGRGRVTLKHPCVTLLLLVQPDLLAMAYSNVRLLLGGFLARCFSADTKLDVQEETEESAAPFDEQVAAEWDRFLKALYAKYHEAPAPYELSVEPGVRVQSRVLHNKIAAQIKDRLADVRSFAVRWTEQAWKVALLLHTGLHGADCDKHPLRAETFRSATDVVRFFVGLQLEVLQIMRLDAVEKTHARLQELFLRYENAPITLRALAKRHRLRRELVLSCVKTYPKIYGIGAVKSTRGGKPSTIIFLRKFTPAGV